jgi:phospholipid transport system substrate-binding protein
MKQWICLLLAPLLSGLAAAHAQAADTRDPLSIVQETMTHTLAVIDERRDEFQADRGSLQKVVREDLLPLLDQEYSARLILGKAGRGISQAELDDFVHAMSTVLVNRYADGLLQFQSQNQVEVLPMKGKNTDKLTRVRTRIKLENGAYAPVDFAFRKTDAGWKAFDVTVEGISYVITFRNQIAPRVLADGIAKVTEDLIAGAIEINE